MESLDVLLEECALAHGHMCPGQILGARMAMLGCHRIGLENPRGSDRKKLIVWVEIDRCMSDAISSVTGVRLGKRSLKYFDYGKVAATFLNTESRKAVRVIAKEASRQLADDLFPPIESKKDRQMMAYKSAADKDLFRVFNVVVNYSEHDEPGSPRSRVICSRCGEGINDRREVVSEDGMVLCRPCDRGGYYEVQPSSVELI
jgi:formylmethanofuran dehydrogenase subunit E